MAVFIYDDIRDVYGAQVGFNAGDGYSSYTLPGALSLQTVYLDQVTNCGRSGVFIYRIDGGYKKLVGIMIINYYILFIIDLTLVECSTSLDCTESDLGIMKASECCVNSLNGSAYTIPGSEECHTCVGKYYYVKVCLI